MVYRVTYALIVEEYIATYKKLNCYKVKLVIWVENIELEHWVASKFGKELARINNNNNNNNNSHGDPAYAGYGEIRV